VTTETKAFDEWAIVEIKGHRKHGGRVTEQVIAGMAFVRVDIPCSPPATRLYGPGAIFCITPTTEELARGFAANAHEPPVQRWELPALPARTTPAPAAEGMFDDDDNFPDEDRET
jgi:hypothetical protein